MFEILCIGSYQLLIQVLNGLAMLTSPSGPAGYGGMVALGLAVGVLITVARAVVTQKLEIQWVLVGWLLYSVMFVPKVTVTVTDIYTGTTNVVANVPIGPAAIGGLTSQVGQTLTEAMGSVFTMPSLSSNGYLDTLTVINALRDLELSDANDGTLNNNGMFGGVGTTVNFSRSIDSYMRNCVMLMLYGNLPGLNTTYSQLQEESDLWAALNVPVTSQYTPLWITEGLPNGAMYTCSAAYTALTTAINTRMMPAYVAYAGKKLKLATPMTEIQNALDTLFGAGKSAQTFMLNSLLKKQFELAEVGALQDAGDTAGVAIRVQAMEQRRVQWATEQSLFQEMARPLIAYIEAFFYAVAPIMAFLLTLGSFGINLFAKYLLLACWIQLWMPMMAVNNLYVQMAASESFTELQNGGHDVLSMVGLNNVWTETASWLATGGMMAGATPLLALMLLTGSYFAMTSLTSRMAGADHVNEKVAAPDIMTSGAVAAVSAFGSAAPRFTNEPLTNTTVGGFSGSGLIAPISWSSSFQQQERSAESAREGAANRVSSGFGSAVSSTWNDNQKSVLQTMMRVGDSGQVSQTDQYLEKVARGMFQNESQWNELSESTRASLKANLAMSLTGDAAVTSKIPGGGGAGISPAIRGGLDNVLETAAQETNGSKDDLQRQFSRAVDTARQNSVQLAGAISVDESTTAGRDYLRGVGVQDSERWGNDVEAFASSEQSYERASSASQQVASQGTLDPIKAAAVMLGGNRAEDRATMEGFAQFMSNRSVVGQWDNWTARNVSPYMHDADQAAVVGGMDLIAKQGSREDVLALHEYLAEQGLVGNAYGTQGDSSSNSRVGSQTPSRSEVMRSVSENAGRPDVDAGTVRGNVSSHMKSEDEVKDEAVSLLNAFTSAVATQNKERANEALSRLEKLGESEAGQRVQDDFVETRGFMQTMREGSLTEATNDLVQGSVRPWVDVGLALGHGEDREAFSKAYDDAQANGKGVISSVAAGLRAVESKLEEAATQYSRDEHAAGYSAAVDVGLPPEVAAYSAELQRLNASPIEILKEEALGIVGERSDHVEELRGAAVRAMGNGDTEAGEKGIVLIERAAQSTSPDKDRLINDAVTIYKGEMASGGIPEQNETPAAGNENGSTSALDFARSRVQ